MKDTNAVIAIYDSHSAADDAVKELQKAGFDMKKLSVVGKGLSHGRAGCWLLQRRRPHEALGQVGRFLGRLLGITIRRRILLGARR